MKKLHLFIITFILFSCIDEKNIKMQKDEPISLKVSQMNFHKIPKDQINFFKKNIGILYNPSIDSTSYNNFVLNHNSIFKNKISLKYKDLSIGLGRVGDSFKKAKSSNSINLDIFSDEAKSKIEEIRDLLNSSTNYEELLSSFNDSKILIEKDNNISQSEKALLVIILDNLKNLSLEYNNNARVRSSGEPKCKWYQWGCVFFYSTAQIHVLFSIWSINNVLGNIELSLLVSEYGLNYIAQCCGYCGCSCTKGCPRWV